MEADCLVREPRVYKLFTIVVRFWCCDVRFECGLGEGFCDLRWWCLCLLFCSVAGDGLELEGDVLVVADGLDGGSLFGGDVVVSEIDTRQRPHVANVVSDKHGISGTQILTAEVKLYLLSAQTTEGGEVLLRLHDLHKLLGLLDWDMVLEEIEARHSPIILRIAVNNSSSTSGQMDMKMVPKRPQPRCYAP